MICRGKGWKPDSPDHRDILQAANTRSQAVPGFVDLSPKMPPIWDQGATNSCTAHAAAAALQFVAKRQEDPSRLMIYYATREIENDVGADDGAEIRSALKAVSRFGACDESVWPFDVSKLKQKPPPAAYANAGKNADYARLYWNVPQTIVDMRATLIDGFPFMFGFTTYESFDGSEIASSGVMQMPKDNEAITGGHAVLAVGYSDLDRVFIIRNSWGKSWGRQGYFTMPYQFITNASTCSDFWTIRATGI